MPDAQSPTRLLADAALLGDSIVPRVAIDVGADGRIEAVTPDPADGTGEPVRGLVLPGIANLHAHAFQRAMAGLAERAGPDGDDFWRWREIMYRFLGRLSPDDVQAVAAQFYAECLCHGYTAVAEFHYLHNAPDGTAYDDPAELSLRVIAAAEQAGIALTLLPVLYCRAGFGGAPASPAQRRFVLDPDGFAALCRRLAPLVRLGVAPHSLRAVTPPELDAAIAVARGLGPATPLHIHAAEQTGEVADCLAWSGLRPVEWLLRHAPLDRHWCVVHATHMTPAECSGLAATGAIAGLCQTTEANLGDGLFPLRDWLDAGGRFGIGSDSNVGTSPVEELRWLEYSRRLQTRRRNVSTATPDQSVAGFLLAQATAAGAAALGRPPARLTAGSPADLVVLDTEHPALVGRTGDALLDAWVFSGNSTPVRHVMVGGAWVVRDQRHRHADAIATNFARAMRRLLAD